MKEPRFASKPASPTANLVEIGQISDEISTLVFFGGGKDSLAMSELLSKADIPFSTLSYSHSLYGRSAVSINSTMQL